MISVGIFSRKAAGRETNREINYFSIIFIFVIWMIIVIRGIMSHKIVGVKGKISYYGIKSNSLFVVFNFIVSVIILVIFAIFVNVILGVIAFILINAILAKWRGVRCKKDGMRMKKIGKKGDYESYKCPKGHIGGILIAAAVASAVHHGVWAGGGFGGGGFGGGGFGGGMSGGGGAGR